MILQEKLKELRKQSGLTQEQAAEKLNVSRAAVARWETGKGIPDISNLITISEVFDISLDELIKGDRKVEKKIVADEKAKKWHLFVILYLVAIIAYIVYFVVRHRIFMVGFLISTLFMLGIELWVYFKSKR